MELNEIISAEKRFADLVETCQGFEFYQAYKDDVDHIIGGKGGTYWYLIMKNGSVTEARIATYQDGVWQDRCTKGRGAKKTTKALPAGSVIKRIAEQAYWMQEAPWVKGRNPRRVEDSHPHFHYMYGFGDKALDVSEQYGVSIAYSDLKDPSAGFHLRDLSTGADVELPR